MDLSIYLAATLAELQRMASYQGSLAYMACHFSSSSRGISGLPSWLPSGSMLMLTDEFPIQDHDPNRVAKELLQGAENLSCSHILLDFQRPYNPQVTEVASAILKSAAIPVGISQQYAHNFQCPVLVCPSPLWTPLLDHLAPWKGREIWLEAVMDDGIVTITQNRSSYEPSSHHSHTPFYSHELCASYAGVMDEESLRFFLHRGKDELDNLLEEAAKLGVTTAIGLYQQLGI